jgi:hypothetical protein
MPSHPVFLIGYMFTFLPSHLCLEIKGFTHSRIACFCLVKNSLSLRLPSINTKVKIYRTLIYCSFLPLSAICFHAGLLFCLFFDPADGDNILLRNMS